MDRQDAKQVYEAGREIVVETLLKMDARIRELEQLVARLIRPLRKG